MDGSTTTTAAGEPDPKPQTRYASCPHQNPNLPSFLPSLPPSSLPLSQLRCVGVGQEGSDHGRTGEGALL